MATASRKTKAASSPLKARLISTRLKKLSIDILLPPEEAGKGSLELTYNIESKPNENLEQFVAILTIGGRGVKKEAGDLVAFTINAELLGMFSVTRQPKKDEEPTLATDMANLITPVLTEMIETTFSKSGYPRIDLTRSFPEAILGNS